MERQREPCSYHSMHTKMEDIQQQPIVVFTGGFETGYVSLHREANLLLYKGQPFLLQLPSFEMTEWDETNCIVLHTMHETPFTRRARAFLESLRALSGDPTPLNAPIYLYTPERPSVKVGLQYTCMVKPVLSPLHGAILFQASAFRSA